MRLHNELIDLHGSDRIKAGCWLIVEHDLWPVYDQPGKGRASFLEERSRGHIDAGAKTAQLMICALVEYLTAPS